MTVARIPAVGYDVVVGPGLLERLDAHLPTPAHAARAALVTNSTVGSLYGDQVMDALRASGLTPVRIDVPDGEDGKTLATCESLYHRFAALPLGRDDLVVALGGGVVGDLAGFAAATWHRGVALAQIPTTVLAQADSAIGGKTGVNLAEGKNLVGAFHQPVAVIADTSTLSTLTPRDRRAGLAEVIKCGFVADPGILDLVEVAPSVHDPAVLTELLHRAAAAKVRVVVADERDTGQRALLNYGHTLGHAIETLAGYGSYRHGEAVSLGMVFAARLAERLGVADRLAERTVRVLDAVGLPTGGLRLDLDAVWTVLQRDKKARGGVRFVLCPEPGQATVIDAPERAIVNEVLQTLS